jgi:phytoene dehydrogenase-like protein
MVAAKIKAGVIGSGPNGLAAAIVLAQAGVSVDVFEAEPTPGGAARTLELTLPGFAHDFGSAVHPLGAGSPFFSSLPLQEHGLHWIHSPAAVAHPLDDGSAVVLESDLKNIHNTLGADAAAWIRLVRPFVDNWQEFAPALLGPVTSLPKHLLPMARFGTKALLSAKAIAGRFQTQRARALFAGLAAHSFLALDELLSGAFGLLMAITAHAVGWPIPRGGARSITNALCAYLSHLGGSVKTSSRIVSLSELAGYELALCDVTPRQLLQIGGHSFTHKYKKALQRFRYGPAVYKVDYALNAPIPWKDSDCLRAATVHLGGNFEEIAASESSVRQGNAAERPFVLLSQPSLFDASRAPEGKHTVWTYCHVPNGSNTAMLSRLEDQIERFAPGFRDCVLARRIFAPADLESMDSNLVGGDICGGVLDIRQFLFRPTWRTYATSADDVYICSASTPPGAGVHGMCGYHAAKMALRRSIETR